MGVKSESPKSHIQKVRITEKMRTKSLEVMSKGAFAGRAESDFYGYLLQIGLVKYEKSILPLEMGDENTGEGEVEKPLESGRRASNE
jgi:hypothetical protein